MLEILIQLVRDGPRNLHFKASSQGDSDTDNPWTLLRETLICENNKLRAPSGMSPQQAAHPADVREHVALMPSVCILSR